MKAFFLRVFSPILESFKVERKTTNTGFDKKSQSLFLFLLLLAMVSPAFALESEEHITPQSTAALVTLEDSLAPIQGQGKTVLHAGLSLSLAPQFHTYWRNPGDAGEAPELTLTVEHLSESGQSQLIGKTDEITTWETPTRFSEAGLTTFGYENQIFFPLEIPLSFSEPFSGKLKLNLKAKWLACAKICIPEKANFTLFVPVAEATRIGAQKELFERATGLAPEKAPFESLLEKDNHLRLKGQAQGKKQAAGNTKEAYFYPYNAGLLNSNAPQMIQQNGSDLILDLVADKTAPDNGNLEKYIQEGRLNGVVELLRNNGQRVYFEIQPRLLGEISEAVSSSKITTTQTEKSSVVDAAPLSEANHPLVSGLKLFFLAFIGGIFLNLMPCVFPVLAMKAFSLAKLGTKERPEAVASAIFYALGTVGTFLSLGIFVLILRHAGHLIGWGFQFQSPFFVILVCWLLLLMALNLAGLFEILPPASAGRHQTAAGHFGDFITGILAVIVASPCTAPFMGVALAGALAASGFLALSIFTALGLGLAFPYILLACWPAMGRFLPKPGAWMEIFKQFLAFPLFAACIWLIWVVLRQGGIDCAVVVLSGGLLLAFAAWSFGIAQRKQTKKKPFLFLSIGYWVAISALVLSFLLLWVLGPNVKNEVHLQEKKSALVQSQKSGLQIVSFHPDTLKALRADGHPVFVDMSAAWCITCLMNERTTLNTEKGENTLQAAGAVFMKGDWTNKDPDISAFLHQYHREGVPLYVWFPKNWPSDKPGILLPQLLTPSILKNRLK
ncbi:cytochrome C biogenesis protein [Acetobacteraceae bacterium]|nr:cytochrome C biogenesis protein [Acetobacteraceae bacterium]